MTAEGNRGERAEKETLHHGETKVKTDSGGQSLARDGSTEMKEETTSENQVKETKDVKDTLEIEMKNMQEMNPMVPLEIETRDTPEKNPLVLLRTEDTRGITQLR